MSSGTTVTQLSQPEQAKARYSFAGEMPILQQLGGAQTTQSPLHHQHGPHLAAVFAKNPPLSSLQSPCIQAFCSQGSVWG